MSSAIKVACEIGHDVELDSIDWRGEPRSDREAIVRMRALLTIVESWRSDRCLSLGNLGVDLRSYLGITAAEVHGGGLLTAKATLDHLGSDVRSIWAEAVHDVAEARAKAKNARRRELIQRIYGD